MKILLKIALYGLGAALLLLLSWGLTLYQRWPLWMVALPVLAVIVFILTVRFVKRLILVYRTKHRVAQAVLQQAKLPTPAERGVGLERRWSEAVLKLRTSHLKRGGNPLYALPWFLMIGPPRAGKTTALLRARLSSPLQDIAQSDTVAETTNCEFWFLNKAVIVDTTGRYASPAAEAESQDEWQRLLFLLAKHRKRESLSGLIVAIGADRLLGADQEALAEEGRLVRKRIDQLMRLLDTKFPVYILVTKCDALYGFDAFCRRLPERILDQAMGYVDGGDDGDARAFLDEAFEDVSGRLKDLRLLVADRLGQVDQRVLLFPSEFDRLKPGLERFWTCCFSSDPYLEPPYVRGLFFSSAEQAGETTSAILKECGLTVSADETADGQRGLFLTDLLTTVLPRDRGLARPFSYVPHWHRMTRNLGLLAWILAGIVCVIVLTGAFARSFATMTKLIDQFPGVPVYTGDLEGDLNGLMKFYPLVKWIEERDRSWLVRHVPFNGVVMALERQLKDLFATSFQKFMLTDLDGRIEGQLSTLSEEHATRVHAEQIQHIVRRINLIRARLGGEDLIGLLSMPPPMLDSLVTGGSETQAALKPEIVQTFGELYVAYVAWSQRDDLLLIEQQTLQKWLDRYALQSGRLNWVDEWADNQPNLRLVTLYDFWPGSRSLPEQPRVRPGYTKGGKAAIDGFLSELEAAAPNPKVIADLKSLYETRYFNEKLRAWYAFTWNFDLGRSILDGELEWRSAVERMTTDQGPYFALLDRLVSEFEDYRDEAKLPEWLRLARRLNVIRPVTTLQGVMDKAKMLTGIVNESGREIITSTVTGGPRKGQEVLDTQLAAARAFQGYLADLNKLWMDAVSGQGRAYKIASDFHAFSVDPAIKESALLGAHKGLRQLKELVGGAHYYETRAVWELVGGPLEFYTDFVEQEASCTLQREWEAKVVFPMQGVDSKIELYDQLYGDRGLVWAFLDGPAKPFLARDALRYVPVETLTYRVPFTADFLEFVNDAVGRARELTAEKQKSEQVQRQVKSAVEKKTAALDLSLGELKQNKEGIQAKPIPVTITPLPTGVEGDARAIPYATTLTVQCAGGMKSVPNYNFPVTVGFEWSPLTCGDTSLQIKIENFTLAKRYPGPLGFARFLQDFYDGHHTFMPSDFPVQQAALKYLGITALTVRYQFSGQDVILSQVNRLDEIERQERELQATRRQIQEQQERVEADAALEPLRDSDPLTIVSAILPARIQRVDRALADVRRTRDSTRFAPVSVSVRGLPTSVNREAKVTPVSTLLTVSCAAETRTVPNYNFPVTMVVDWSPGDCGDTTLEIKLGEIAVTKRYAGPLGFARFIEDFYDGEHSFTPADFPADQSRLEQQHLTSISVRYEFKGHESTLEQMRQIEALDRQEQRLLQARQRFTDQLERLEEQILREPQVARPSPKLAQIAAVPHKISACWEGGRAGSSAGGVGPVPEGTPATPKQHTAAPMSASALSLAKPVALRSAHAARGYEVQVGAFLEGTDALALARALEPRGYFPYIVVETDEAGRRWHTVFIGQYPDRVVAVGVAERYKQQEALPALVRESHS